MGEIDFIEKIHVAAYWRKQLGEYEYVNHNPDDLLRWYIALETRGPLEIRSYLNERASRYPMQVVTGIVSVAPHPPLTIVQLWLASHERFSSRPYWMGALTFGVLCYFVATNLQGCASLTDINTLANKPPNMNLPVPPTGSAPLPAAAATLPNVGTPPASVASPPTGGGLPAAGSSPQ